MIGKTAYAPAAQSAGAVFAGEPAREREGEQRPGGDRSAALTSTRSAFVADERGKGSITA